VYLRSRPVVRQPTAIPGAERKRIEVSVRDLRALSPGAAAVVCEQARALVSAFVLDKATQRKAILWGHDLQQAHGNLVTEMLAQPLDDYINPDRPGLADGSNVVGADRIQVETGIQQEYRSSDGNHSRTAGDCESRGHRACVGWPQVPLH
tara:strand:+ start:297 stop:746 length:450 start_codon:yes stop_codon:yes gene_type:complete